MLGSAEAFAKAARDGVLEERGMVGFAAELSAEDVERIRAYVIRRAHEMRRSEAAAAAAKKSE